jgi:biotin transport system substrate-specific component
MQATIPSRVITGRVLPSSTAWTVAITVGFALLTAGAAQVRIPLPFTPVPITGQTFAVLLSGAALGATWGGASQLLYLLMGAVGLPFFAGGESGLSYVTGATGGYLIGFIVAAAAIGYLAEHRQDRTVAAAIPAFLTGNLLIYSIGVPWLYNSVESITTGEAALSAGFIPFIAGDIVKIVLAGLLLPTAWKLVDRR